MDQEQLAQSVWRRVRGTETVREPVWLHQLLEDQAAETALWQKLARGRGGVYAQTARQKSAMLRCLRGIHFLAAGRCPQINPPKQESADLRRSAARGMALWKVFDDHAADPDFGPVFQSLRQEQQIHCRLTLELLGAQPPEK